jgi:hypothetical protein
MVYWWVLVHCGPPQGTALLGLFHGGWFFFLLLFLNDEPLVSVQFFKNELKWFQFQF